MKSLLSIKDKIFTLNQITPLVQEWKKNNQTIVFTNGCFDIIHLGHIDYLQKTSQLADKLVVGLNSDNSVKRLKGAKRPIQDEYSRAMILASMSFIDAVIYFEDDTPINLIKEILPNVLVKGGDYSVSNIVGATDVIQNGGSVAVLPYIKGHSTTAIEQKIKSES